MKQYEPGFEAYLRQHFRYDGRQLWVDGRPVRQDPVPVHWTQPPRMVPLARLAVFIHTGRWPVVARGLQLDPASLSSAHLGFLEPTRHGPRAFGRDAITGEYAYLGRFPDEASARAAQRSGIPERVVNRRRPDIEGVEP